MPGNNPPIRTAARGKIKYNPAGCYILNELFIRSIAPLLRRKGNFLFAPHPKAKKTSPGLLESRTKKLYHY
jgi:hypothetical protein